MLLLVSSLVLCACANGLAVGENTAAPSPIVYKGYAGVGRYFVDPLNMTWPEASKACKKLNGHLAFPETAAQLAVLKSILFQLNISYAHIGFHDKFVEGKYITVQDKPLSGLEYAAPWEPGQPNGGNNANCGALFAQGLNDVGCGNMYPAICEERDPLGYERIGSYGLYKMMTVDTEWPDAVEFCRAQGSHLWIINSADEHAAVYDHYNTSSFFWTGAHHLYEDRFFVTIFDETLEEAGYSTWIPGEPSGSNIDYPYVAITVTGLLIWKTDLFFICEYNPPCLVCL